MVKCTGGVYAGLSWHGGEYAIVITSKKSIITWASPRLLCPYCSKLHQEIKKALKVRPDIAWLIKLMPIKKDSREVVETILCEKSLELLDAAFSGKQLAPPTCKNASIDLTLQIAAGLGIRSTPTLIMPNGQIVPGYKELDHLLKVVDENTPAVKTLVEGQDKKE